MFTLRREPEAFQALDTGLITETFALDGSGFQFGLGETIVQVPAFDVRVFKTAEGDLVGIHLDLRYVPQAVVYALADQLGSVDDLPELTDVGEQALAMLLGMDDDAVNQVVKPIFGSCDTIEALLAIKTGDGVPVFFDLTNYAVIGLRA